MGWGSGNIGGGGAQLNFAVKRYRTEAELLAATPKENTIGVISEVDITSYVFSAAAPDAPEEGTVWFLTGTSSATEFNALKKNALRVYPISAKQYVGGSWVDVPVMSYQSGSWAAWWNGELFLDGNQFEAVTGGWESIIAEFGSDYGSSVPTMEIHDTLKVGYKVSATGIDAGAAITKKKINLTDWKTLSVFVKELKCTAVSYYTSIISIDVWNDNDTTKTLADIRAASTSIYSGKDEVTLTDLTANLDVSALSGEYYIAVYVKFAPASGGGEFYVDISEIILSGEAT